MERLGDVKDRYRELAMTCLVEYWKAIPIEVGETYQGALALEVNHGE